MWLSIWIRWTAEALAGSALVFVVLWFVINKTDGWVKMRLLTLPAGIAVTAMLTSFVRIGSGFILGPGVVNPSGQLASIVFLGMPAVSAVAVIYLLRFKLSRSAATKRADLGETEQGSS